MDIDHTSMENSGRAIHAEGGEFDASVKPRRERLEALIPHFGNPATDEAARLFRKGADGHPGFDSAYEDLTTAHHNLRKAYEDIGNAVVGMSRNVQAANWASMVDKNAFIKDLVDFARRKDDEVSVPTTPVERA
ncbi:hypothetical protein [Nonomuraea jiangxiensis]|uniref:Uncharacterized protein n=1 Tax=Nonomuraea jiangxiensis TaxID=633440 RepID=A0A1G8LEZ1_9ACTN|nr:hypothetical protein [Nonomuraea jiangxiensis]SDI54215.1 hypothetical protein SAMN05421869_10674 [Nonomuraea jiangxiensis]